MKQLHQYSKKFRQHLVWEMERLNSTQINCQNCTGLCCTVTRNSMQVTPIEALNLYFEIKDKIKDQKKFWELNQETTTQFGLDREIYVKNKLLRKNYTCPLFKFESWGCPIDPYLKPLGCLGYNPFEKNVTNGEQCQSNTALLEKVENEIIIEWKKINLELQKKLKLDFEKISIPRALNILDKALQHFDLDC